MSDNSRIDDVVVCVIGLGYVGLPLVRAFSRKLTVIGFDIDAGKVSGLVRENTSPNLSFTDHPDEITRADFIIMCLPTPLDEHHEPDLSYLQAAAKTVGRNLKEGVVVILESTVYPGLTEEVLVPALEGSGKRCGRDFKIAYSPERINPGDDEHSIEKVTKVVAGLDAETSEVVAALYQHVTPNVFRARDIRTAEAAKVVENVQRDVNIALMNEFSLIFEKLGLSTKDVFAAAATKWNFHRYSPGLVGGHCIPIVPHYLRYKSTLAGYEPRIITAGRSVSDDMPEHVALITTKALIEAGKAVKGARVLVMGLTYKEDVDDMRDSPVKQVIARLKDHGIEPVGYDPLLETEPARKEFGIECIQNWDQVARVPIDGIILAVVHAHFKKLHLKTLKDLQRGYPVLIDLRGWCDGNEAKNLGFSYKTL